MMISEDKNRSKSSKRIKAKSPLNMKHNFSQKTRSKEKTLNRKSHGNTNDSLECQRRAYVKLKNNNQSGDNKMKNSTSTQSFKNKIFVSNYELNRLKQKLQNNSRTSKGNMMAPNPKKNGVKLNIRIFDQMGKETSKQSNTNTTGFTQTEQGEILKIENEYFKKIYDQALGELSKLKNKLREQKKVHQVQKQIYEFQLNKLKRIIDSEKEQIEHIICDEESSLIIVVSTINTDSEEGILGLESYCQDQTVNQ